MAKRETKARRSNKKKRFDKGNYLYGNYIYVTEHAINRYQERIKKMSRKNAIHSIIESVKRSRLIALTKYGGREIRENRGIIYVCELQGNCLNVITVLVSEVDLRFVS
mgnify:FL=1